MPRGRKPSQKVTLLEVAEELSQELSLSNLNLGSRNELEGLHEDVEPDEDAMNPPKDITKLKEAEKLLSEKLKQPVTLKVKGILPSIYKSIDKTSSYELRYVLTIGDSFEIMFRSVDWGSILKSIFIFYNVET